MTLHVSFAFRFFLGAAFALVAACSAPGDDPPSLAGNAGELERADAGEAGSIADDPERPPMGAPATIDAWIAKGYYRSWACETRAHDARPPSGHSPNRICSNARLSGHGAGEYPVGAASVKELYDDSGTNIVGYAIARKAAAGAGAAWYWYERLGTRVVANGLGTNGPAQTICTRCHLRAGPASFGHDLVFTQVPPTIDAAP